MTELPAGWTIERVREVAQGHAELTPVDTVATVDHFTRSDDGTRHRDGTTPLNVTCIVNLSGLYLVNHADDGEWHMGQIADHNVIRCWASYGNDFEQAIKGL